MSLVPTIYNSADPSAPQLTGQVGSFLSLLRALLVNGYGSGGTLKLGLGWTESHTGTNKAVFRNNPTSGTGYKARVDDSNALYALIRGYETMSDVDTGTQPVPTIGQFTNGIYWPKSITANATARAWWAIGNEKSLYLFVDAPGNGIADAVPYFLGDIKSIRAGDNHNFLLSQNALTSYAGSPTVIYSGLLAEGAGVVHWRVGTAAVAAGYLARNYALAPGAVTAFNPRAEGFTASSGVSAWGGPGYPTYPNPSNNGLLYSRGVILEGIGLPRGFMPGLYTPFHNRPFSDQADVPDVEGLASGTILIAKSFMSLTPNTPTNSGQVLFDKTNAW